MAGYISYLAKFLRAEDVLFLGMAEMKIKREDFDKIIAELSQLDEEDQPLLKEQIGQLLKKYEDQLQPAYLDQEAEKIKKYFTADSFDGILKNLEEGLSLGDSWAEKTLKELRKKSLLSQYIIFEQIKRAKNLSLEECFDMELRMSINFMDNPDFFEGLRSVLVDKDEPKWKYKSPEDIDQALIDSFFK